MFTHLRARHLRFVTVALLIVLVGATALLMPGLPRRFPSHFDASGNVDALVLGWWGGRAIWWLFPILCCGLILTTSAIARAVLDRPRLWTSPDRELFQQLSAQEKLDTRERLQRIPAWAAVGLAVMFIAIQRLVHKNIVSETPYLSASLFWTAVVGMVLTAGLAIGAQLSARRWMRQRATKSQRHPRNHTGAFP